MRDQLPKEDSILAAAWEDQGPRTPEGATCRSFATDDTTTIFRFCFRAGKLVAKYTFKDES